MLLWVHPIQLSARFWSACWTLTRSEICVMGAENLLRKWLDHNTKQELRWGPVFEQKERDWNGSTTQYSHADQWSQSKVTRAQKYENCHNHHYHSFFNHHEVFVGCVHFKNVNIRCSYASKVETMILAEYMRIKWKEKGSLKREGDLLNTTRFDKLWSFI